MDSSNAQAVYNNYELLTSGANHVGDAPGSMDSNTELCNLMYEIYSINGNEGYKLSSPPSDLQIKTLAGGVNRLMAYFNGNVPTQANNPAAYAVYEALTGTGIPGGESFSQLFADVAGSDAGKASSALAALEGPGASFVEITLGGEANNFVHNPNVASYPNYNKGDTTLQSDVHTLQTDLSTYNTDVANGASATIINRDLVRLAGDVVNFNTDCGATAGGEKDSALFCLTDMLGSASDPTSLLATATALQANPTNAADLAAFQTALNGAGEGVKNGAQDLTGMLNYSLWCESW